MSKNLFTPGPWAVEHEPFFIKVWADDCVLSEQYLPEEGEDVTHLEFREELDRALANARLIAAAPELLEALVVAAGAIREICHVCDAALPNSTLERAARAIARARGEA